MPRVGGSRWSRPTGRSGPPARETGPDELEEADAVTFTSSSTVAGYLELAGARRLPPVVACIGPVTACTAMKAGLKVDVVASVHTVEGLVQALTRWADDKGATDPAEVGSTR